MIEQMNNENRSIINNNNISNNNINNDISLSTNSAINNEIVLQLIEF